MHALGVEVQTSGNIAWLASGLMSLLVVAACSDANLGETQIGVDAGANPPDAAPAAPDADVADPPADAAPPPPDAAPPCDAGNTNVSGPNGECYMLFSAAPATWVDAAAACIALGNGTRLADIANAGEDALLIALAGSADAWLGARDLSEGLWLWTDGSTVAYTNWGANEPNNNGGSDGEEDCMVMRKVGTTNDPNYNVGTWDDRPCSRIYNYICER